MCPEFNYVDYIDKLLGNRRFYEMPVNTRISLNRVDNPLATELNAAALGEVLTALGDLQDRLAAAQAAFPRRLDAAHGHDADG